MKIYLAARYSRNPEMREVASYLKARGHQITSRWINGSHEIGDVTTDLERRQLALDDWLDLQRSDAMLAYSETPRSTNDSRGGRHVEFGLALAWNIPIYVVGPRENVFHYLHQIQNFQNTVEAAHALEDKTEKKG